MKKNFLKWSSLFTLAAMVFSGCSADATDDVVAPEGGKPKSSITVNAQFGDDTRVNANDDSENKKFTTVWGDDDDMVVLNDKDPNECGVFTIEEHDGKTAKFTCDEFPKIDGAQYRAIYPADAWTMEDTALSSLPILLPAEQKPTDASVIDPNAVILVSDIKTIENNTLDFKFTHVAAYVKLGLKNLIAGKIAKVVISTEETPIAGEFTYDGKTVTAAETAVNEITVNPDITVENNGDIHEICFSMFPTELDNMRIDVTYADGTTMYKSVSNVSFKFNAGEVRLINVTLTADPGTKANPYTVTEAVALYNNSEAPKDKVWVSGIIRGYFTGNKAYSEDLSDADKTANTNLAIGDNYDDEPASVQLPDNKVRTALNLKDHPENLYAKVAVYGKIEAYFQVAGIKEVTDYVLTENPDPHLSVLSPTTTVGYTGDDVEFKVIAKNLTDEIVVTSSDETNFKPTLSADNTTLTVKVTENETTEPREATITLSANGMTAKATISQEAAPKPDEPAFVLVTDIKQLSADAEVIIVNNNKNQAMSATQSGNNRGQASVTVTDDKITTVGEDVAIVTLGVNGSYWTLKTTGPDDSSTGYLYAASSSSNHLKTQTFVDGNAKWSIEIAATGVATVKAQGTNTRNWLRYNGSNNPPIFSCYGSGQNDIYLFVKEGTGTGEQPIPEPTLSVDPTSLSFTAEGGEQKVTATVENSNETVTCEISGDGFTAKQEGNVITVTAAANDGAARTGELVVKLGDLSQTVKLSQEGANGGETPKEDLNLEFAFTKNNNPGNWPTLSGSGTYQHSGYSFILANCYYNSTSGFLMMNKSNGKLGLPAISGYKLVSVEATSNTSASAKVTVAIKDADGNDVSGGAQKTWSPLPGPFTYALSGTAENTVYYITVTNANNAQINTLKLTYTPADGNGGGTTDPGPGTDPDEPVNPQPGESKTYVDELTAEWAGVTQYQEWTKNGTSSKAVYTGISTTSTNPKGAIQINDKNNYGIITTKSGGKVKKIVVTIASGSNELQVYGKNTAYTSTANLYASDAATQGSLIGSTTSTTTITVNDDYEYIGFRSRSGALYISKIEVTWEE